MAKDTSSTKKALKPAKKASHQDLKADVPAKVKKTKHVEQEPAPAPADPSSSNPKKGKKSRLAEKEVEELDKFPTKKEKKRESAVVPVEEIPVEKADDAAAKKRKRKSAAVEATVVAPAEKAKKTREAAPAKPQPAEDQQTDAGEKKRKRKSAAQEHADEDKASKKRKDSEEAAPATPAKLPVSESKATKKTSKAPATQEADKPVRKDTKKSSAKAAKPAPEEEAEEEDAADEQEQELYGFSSDDDSSDEEDMVDDMPGVDVGKLPTIAKDDATVKRKLEKAKRKPTEDRGVIYIGRIPHGFYEDQMRAYFSQFGDVTRLRISRNKKTGKPKHYGFVEFDSSSVAKIVAETMDNYLLMGHILTCKLIPKDQVHPELWVGANRKWRPVPRDRVARVAHNKPRTEEEVKKAETRLLKRQEQRKRKLEEAGIKYDFEAIAYKKKPKPTEA